MNEYFDITHTRGNQTQAVWGMKPAFELSALTRTQHGILSDSIPTLAQGRDDAENNLTTAITDKTVLFTKQASIATRLPGMMDGMLDDDDPLKDQLDAIYAIETHLSEAHILRRCRLVLPFWTDVNAARAAQVPAKPPVTLDYLAEVGVDVNNFASTIAAALVSQKTEAEKQRLVTNAKSALRTADRKTDRANKRWYKAWLKAYPVGTPEGDAAASQITTEAGTADAQALEILTLTPLPAHTIRVNLDPAGGAHATTKTLHYKLPGETEFGHATQITGLELIIGPFPEGVTVSVRTLVSNSNAGTVSSAIKSAVVG